MMIAACEKEIDIEYHDIDPLPVIEAELTPDGCRVSITLTTPMDEPMNHTRLEDATVILSDLTSGISYTLSPDAEGYFRDTTPGVPGHDYGLEVTLQGEVYTARAHMYPPARIVNLEFNWINMPYDQVAIIEGQYVDTDTVPGDCYWIKLYRNGQSYGWYAQDDRGVTDGIVTFAAMTSRRDTDEEDDDEVLFEGDVMTMSVSQISREMHNYLEALQNDSNGPAMFTGACCLGYFIATCPTEKSITFHPDRIPVFQ